MIILVYTDILVIDVYNMLFCSPSTPESQQPIICFISCPGDAKTLDECDLTIATHDTCKCKDVVGIKCSK